NTHRSALSCSCSLDHYLICTILIYSSFLLSLFLFFNDPATTEIYTRSLHDALPILSDLQQRRRWSPSDVVAVAGWRRALVQRGPDRKSTRLNSSHVEISYAVFCLKKKKKKKIIRKTKKKNA